MFRRKYAWAVFYTLVLTAFTVYAALDTFVISRVYAAVPPAESSQGASGEEQPSGAEGDAAGGESGETAPAEPVITENSYSDGAISVTITQYREHETDIYVADVRLSSPDQLKTALAQNAYGRNVTQKTSEMAEAAGAILAVNGDYYGSQEQGYVIRNGVLYRDTSAQWREDLVIYEDGSFAVVSEEEVTAQQLLEDGAVQVLSFGPALVEEGAVSVSPDDEVGKSMASNPRTAIGVVDGLHYLFVVSDGRTEESQGLSLYQLAEFMESLGASTAYNLDGGGSSTLWFCGSVINYPTTNGRTMRERSVSDIVYIGY